MYSMVNDCPLFVFNFLRFGKRFPLCLESVKAEHRLESLESVKAEYRLDRLNQLVTS